MKISRFDILNTAVAALRDGLTSLYNLYLVTRLGLDPVQVGWVLSTPSGASLVLQVPLGVIYDRLPRPGNAIGLGAVGLGLVALAFGLNERPSLPLVLGLQVAYGIAMSTLAAGMPALSTGLHEGAALGRRLARNEVFAKIGNLGTLALGGVIAQIYELRVIFLMIPVLAVPVVCLSWGLGDATKKTRHLERETSDAWWTSPAIYLFAIVTLTFFFASSAALSMFEQVFSRARTDGGSGWIASVAIATQATVTLTILGVGRVGRPSGLSWLMVAAFGLIAIRLIALSSGVTVGALIVGQVLDGVIDGVVLTVPARLVAHRFPENFNLISGVLGAVASLAAMASTLFSGPLMMRYGYPFAMNPYVLAALAGLTFTLVVRSRLAEAPVSANSMTLDSAVVEAAE